MARLTRKEFLDGITKAMEDTPQPQDQAALREKVLSMANKQPLELKMKPVNKTVNTNQSLNKVNNADKNKTA